MSVVALVSVLASGQSPADQKDWIQLFNGKNLDGWVPKITGYALGDNYGDTFRVVNGVLQASYDKYANFESKFGHLFYERRSSRITSSPPSTASSASRWLAAPSGRSATTA